MAADGLPSYDHLPLLGDSGERHAWGAFGDGDQLGCLNFLTPERIAAAAGLILDGTRVSLNLPIGTPARVFWAPDRPQVVHRIVTNGRSRDDHLDGFALQGTTQWDALAHRGYRQWGWYGFREEKDLDAGALGIDAVAAGGVFGRGVLVDVAGARDRAGTPIDPTVRTAIDAEMIEATCAVQGVEVRPGDVLIVRTGWLDWFLERNEGEIEAMTASFVADPRSAEWPGVDPRRETVAWLWDHRIAAIAADNPTLEAIRHIPEDGYIHHRLLALLGMPLGELWKLDELAAACRERGRWDFFLASAPLDLPRGVGSPANAYALL